MTTLATEPNLFTSDDEMTRMGADYLRIVGFAYPFLGLGLSLYFFAQGRGRTPLPLMACGTRLFVAGLGGAFAVYFLGGDLDSLFRLMALGLFLYAGVMIVIMRRDLGITSK